MFEKNLQGAVQVVSCGSPLNSEAIADFNQTFSELLACGQPMTVFDMSGVPLLDSQGLEALLDMQERYSRRGVDLKLSGLNPLCTDIVHVTQVDQRLSIFDKLIDALGSFAK
ncbi:MAG: STAS domain-containing protein [Planctomycetota bacterium]|nr:STAS domain-containing protein [Planctomycetota bacterium]